MGDTDMISKKASQLNFNSFLALIAIGAIGWNATTTVKLNEKMARVETLLEERESAFVSVEKRVQTIEAIIGIKPKQLP